MVYPAIFYVLDINNQLNTNRKIDTLLSEKITNLDKAKQYLTTLSGNLTAIDSSLPKAANIARYLQDLEQKMQASQAVISNIGIDETQLTTAATDKTPQVIPIKYTISLTGSFDSLRQSLNHLEKMDRFTDITSAAFSAKKETGNEIKLTLKANTYFYGVPELIEKPIGGSRWR